MKRKPTKLERFILAHAVDGLCERGKRALREYRGMTLAQAWAKASPYRIEQALALLDIRVKIPERAKKEAKQNRDFGYPCDDYCQVCYPNPREIWKGPPPELMRAWRKLK